MGNVAQRLSFNKTQGGGVSPSSTDDSYRAPVVDAPPAGNAISTGPNKPAEQPPESSDTSHGVEATAVRKLAATTGTVAILGTTAQTPEHPTPSHEPQIVGETLKEEEKLPVPEECIEITLDKPEEQVVPQDEEKVPYEVGQVEIETVKERYADSASSDSARQVPQITETLVASLENSPVEEVASRRSSPDGVEMNSTDASGVETQITRSTDVVSEDQIEGGSGLPKASKAPSDEAKSENNDSTRTLDNDISSEQMKTNSLSDISFSDMDEKEAGVATIEQQVLPEAGKVEEPSTESDKSEAELKLVEITPDSVSDSSPQITKEESTSDITTDQQDVQQGDEEQLLISTPSDERASDIEEDDESKRNNAAIKIQSSFRGFKVRKARSTKQEDDQLEEQLTLSEIEIVKQQVEGIIKEAEETTESLRNTPDINNVVNTDEDFPDPPDETVLNQLDDDDSQFLNSETVPYPNTGEDTSQQAMPLAKSDSEEKQSPTDNEESTTAVLARMTADEDLPAPDFELLESSCTDDLTEVPSDKVDDEPQDSTSGDVTLEEDSDKLKEQQKQQETVEVVKTPEVDLEIAATKIQANVRGFLARKQVEMTKEDAPDEQQSVPSDEPTPPPTPAQDVAKDNSEVTAADSQVEETPVKSSPVPQLSEKAEEGKIDEKDKQVPSETSDAVELPEEPIVETTYAVDEGLDKMSSQSDSISQDTISQNTVEELLKQHDHVMPIKAYFEENTGDAVLQPQDTIDDRTDNDITADIPIIPESLVKTIPDINEKIAQDEAPEIIPTGIREILNEQPKAITPDLTDKDGNENSSQSIDELSSNPDRENLNPSNDNSTIDVPEISSAEETKGSSTASINSDSTKEKTSLGEANESIKENGSKASNDIDFEEMSKSDIRTSDDSTDPPKSMSEPIIEAEAPKANGDPPKSMSEPIIEAEAPKANGDPPKANGDAPAINDSEPASKIDDAATKSTGEEPKNQEGPAENENENEETNLKNLTKAPSEIDELETLLNASATKIQANVRGYLSRKKQTTNESVN